MTGGSGCAQLRLLIREKEIIRNILISRTKIRCIAGRKERIVVLHADCRNSIRFRVGRMLVCIFSGECV